MGFPRKPEMTAAPEVSTPSTPPPTPANLPPVDAKWQKVSSSGNFFKFEQPGDTIEGVYLSQNAGQFGPVASIRLADGSTAAFPIQTALRLEWEKNNIQPGTEIKVVYLGKQKNNKTGREFKAFDLYLTAPKEAAV